MDAVEASRQGVEQLKIDQHDDTKIPEKATGDDAFDLTLKKKKKKKKVNFDDEAAGENEEGTADASNAGGPTTTNGEDGEEEDVFAGLKKKKKKATAKAVETVLGEEGSTDATQVADDDEMLFAELKKKKKKSKKSAAFEEDLGISPEDASAEAGQARDTNNIDTAAWTDSSRDYTYEELLQRVYRLVQQQNPEHANADKKVRMAVPIIARDGSKKTSFANFSDICKRLKRQPEHVIQFIMAELGTSGSVDGNNRLIIKGRFQQKQIESVLRRYINEYVVCKNCKSSDTLLTRENRLMFVTCETCKSKRSVSAIKTGFQAQTTKRKANK